MRGLYVLLEMARADTLSLAFHLSDPKDLNSTMTQTGSPLWAAPELLAGKRYNEDVDTYSFGIVMYEVAVRELPYADLRKKKGNKIKMMQEIAKGFRRPELEGHEGCRKHGVGLLFRKRESVQRSGRRGCGRAFLMCSHLLFLKFSDTARGMSRESAPRWESSSASFRKFSTQYRREIILKN